MVYEKRESYAHQYAKDLLASWLIKGVVEFEDEDFGANSDLGVKTFTQTEYPITTDFPEYIDRKACREFGKCGYRENRVPSKCMNCKKFMLNSKLLAVADIACMRDGKVKDVIEVVYKNGLTEEKLGIYRKLSKKNYLNLWTVDARHILGQIQETHFLYGKYLGGFFD